MTKTQEPSRDVARLIEIMAQLRTPETGCPWDLEQTFETIAPYTIEEAYEVADAIARGDLADLKDELGDLLLQVVYHARMAEELGAFQFGDVVDGVTRKMIRRHPHVFGDATARDAGAVKGLWETIKAEERAEKARERARLAQLVIPDAAPGAVIRDPGPESQQGASGSRRTPSSELASAGMTTFPDAASLLANVPLALPALTRALKLQDKAAKVGFDWPNLAPVFDKLKEEIAEFEAVALPADPRGAANSGAPATSGRLDGGESDAASKSSSEGAIKEEFGDLVFVMANIARHLKIDPEAALRGANQKFTRRFAHIEARLAEKGRTPEQSSLEEMDALWDEAKAIEKA
ncbi:MAG: nucleoside triphosphate pyrophosphohydrolase [Hyphomicrobium sp.]